MQAVLTLVLGVSILLAWLMSRAHAARIYPAKWETQKVGGLSIDVPAGWSAAVVRSRYGRYMEVNEVGLAKQNSRQLTVIDQPNDDQSLTSSREVAMSILNDESSAGDFQPIDFLGHNGVWIEVPTEISGDALRRGSLNAFVLLPSNRVVWVRMTGPPTFVPGDIQLFKRVVQSLKDLRGKGHSVARTNRRGLLYVSCESSGFTASGDGSSGPSGG